MGWVKLFPCHILVHSSIRVFISFQTRLSSLDVLDEPISIEDGKEHPSSSTFVSPRSQLFASCGQGDPPGRTALSLSSDPHILGTVFEDPVMPSDPSKHRMLLLLRMLRAQASLWFVVLSSPRVITPIMSSSVYFLQGRSPFRRKSSRPPSPLSSSPAQDTTSRGAECLPCQCWRTNQ